MWPWPGLGHRSAPRLIHGAGDEAYALVDPGLVHRPVPEEETARAIAGDAVWRGAIDRAVTKGIMHRNTAARRKSSLARKLNAPA